MKTAAVTITGSSSYAVLDTPFRFTCEGTGRSDSQILRFKKNFTDIVCSIINPFNASCRQFTTNPGYSCSCGQNGVYYMNISSVRGTDNSNWTCAIFPNTSKPVSLSVFFPPDITFKPVDITEKTPLTLMCETYGRPESYTFDSFTQYWGNTIVDSQNGTQNGGVYSWRKETATFLDTGIYECSVNNGIRDRQGVLVQKKRVNVLVRASPKFTRENPQIIGAEIGSTVTLSQNFYSSTMNYTSVTWTLAKTKFAKNESTSVKRNNVTLEKNDKRLLFDGFVASINITNFEEQHIGMYTVTICNTIGCNSSNVNLTAEGPPLVPLELMVINTTQSSISLRWKPNFPGGDFTQVFIVHYRLQGSRDWKTQEYEDNTGGYVYAEIKRLQPGSVYEFRIRARNNREGNVMQAGNFTEIVFGETENVPKSEESIRVGLGIGLGICIPIIIGLVITLIYYRRRNLSTQSKDHTHQPANMGTGQQFDEAIMDQSRNQNSSEYAHLEQRRPEHYEHIKSYENTKGTSGTTTEYENPPQNASTTYEKVEPLMYVNSVKDAKDPTYINTRKAQQTSNI